MAMKAVLELALERNQKFSLLRNVLLRFRAYTLNIKMYHRPVGVEKINYILCTYLYEKRP